MKYLILLLILPFSALAGPPEWLQELKEQKPRVIVVEDNHTGEMPKDGELGYWKVVVREETPVYHNTRTIVINGKTVPKRVKEIHVKLTKKWQPMDFYYHVNSDSLIIHAPWCRYYDCDTCTLEILNIELWIKELGARPCKICKPLEGEQ